MIKFRSMVVGAEKMTGPIWASSNDPRVTRVGRFLRRLRLDEIPQLINVLDGDMSLVGPRPERPFFVEKLKRAFPLYARRLRVRPGITGWAQVKGEYDQSMEHVKQKLAYDLFYLENMSLRMDLKIILNTIYVMLRGRGH
jgi:lipopolysaccharide/colanic/teichoic acid biosynthesis glycosyltransferase